MTLRLLDQPMRQRQIAGAPLAHVVAGIGEAGLRHHGNSRVVEADQFARERAQIVQFLADQRVSFSRSQAVKVAQEGICATRNQLRSYVFGYLSSHKNAMRTSKDWRVNRRVSRRDTGFQWFQRLNPENSRLCVPLWSRTNRWETRHA